MRMRSMAMGGVLAVAAGMMAGAGTMPATQPATSTAAVKVMGIETRGKRIVFILDHSGSMLDTFDFLRAFTLAGIDSLGADREAALLLVAEDVEVLGEKKVVPMTDAAKKKIGEALAKVRARGSGDDLLSAFGEGFKKAFLLKPDTIFFLTDGHFDPRLPQQVRTLNAKKTVVVNTVAFINHEPSYEEALKEMARANGGQFRFVSDKELERKGK